METLGRCIRAWMEEKNLSVADLTGRMGYKSKTTVFRLLNGQSNYASCEQFCDRLTPELSADWQERFKRALLAEKIGIGTYRVLEELDSQLFFSEKGSRTESGVSISSPAGGGRIFILGCPWKMISGLVKMLLAQDGEAHIFHYMTRREVIGSPSVLPLLIREIPDVRYQAFFLDNQDLKDVPISWNTIFRLSGENGSYLIPQSDGKEWKELQLPGGYETLEGIRKLLYNLPQASLYRFDGLKNGREYIEFTKNALKMERGRDAVIIKPTPGMQMLPADAVISAFSDYLSDNLEPVRAARDSLIYIFRQRAENFYDPGRHTDMVLSESSMMNFMRTGRMDDHFYAFRPYTREERTVIFQALHDFAQRKGNHIQLLHDRTWPISVEAYDGYGALLYPSRTNYNAETDSYRELFLPGKDFYDLIRTYVRDMLMLRGTGISDVVSLF